ncbi:MAG: arsenite methyltransferase [Thermoplasmatota archaeon]
MTKHDEEAIREAVRERYGSIARDQSCGCAPSTCCGDGASGPMPSNDELSAKMGYSAEERENVPDGANLGLGCGNPHAFASMQPGEVVLDLGSGAGFDCFIAARSVGPAGRVIGVDMTPDMISKARENARKGEYHNVEFRLGEIENIPSADSCIDVIISNCVINLSTNKQRVFDESYRVLRPGGRLVVSDVIATTEVPPEIRDDLDLYSSCAGGALSKEEIDKMLKNSGFVDISITPKDETRELIKEWNPDSNIEDIIVSSIIEARKPL